MSTMASQTTDASTVYAGADQRKNQSSASLAIVRGIHRCPVNSPHKGPVTRKMFPFGDVIIICLAFFSHISLAANDFDCVFAVADWRAKFREPPWHFESVTIHMAWLVTRAFTYYAWVTYIVAHINGLSIASENCIFGAKSFPMQSCCQIDA